MVVLAWIVTGFRNVKTFSAFAHCLLLANSWDLLPGILYHHTAATQGGYAKATHTLPHKPIERLSRVVVLPGILHLQTTS